MACMEEKLAYPGKSLGMEDNTLTLEQIERLLPAPREISSVRIREFDDSTANPEPIAQDEEADQLLEEFLSPSKLRSLTGFKNLDEVEYLEMKVDTRENSLGNFGALLPSLVELKISNSIIATVRDLGTSLTNLRTLWLSRSGLSDLDGISSVSSLKELYLAFNHIEDVSPVSMLDQLEILDLEGNNVSDITQVEFLCLCSSLKLLTLEGNPICTAPHPLTTHEEIKSYDYRSAIHKAVPNVKILDDEPYLVEKVDGKPVLRQPPASHRANKVPKHLKADWQLVSEGIKAVSIDEEEESSFDVARPGSAAGVSRQERPSSAMSTRQRPASASRQRPASAMGQRPGSAGGGAEPIGVFHQDDSSDLTHGSSQVICGNISRALKSRRKDLKSPKTPVMPVVAFLESPRLYTPEKSFEEDTETSASKNDILEELKAWREEYSMMLNDERSAITNSEDKSRTSYGGLPPSTPVQEAPTTPTYSPSPPTKTSRRPGSPSAVRRSLPTPPLMGKEMMNRPNTAADFRMRRFRQPSGETSVNQLRLRTLHGDESFEVDKNTDTSPSPQLLSEQDSEARSSTAPVRINRRTREMPTKDGTRPSRKLPDPALLGHRPGTAAAALQKRKLRPSQN
ncbi:Leucine-rich repeat-containing protein 56 [Desmophyllum pertusum]|uniref:Leucine-rich repeat-containing protein 56 n=1 Tax=Desmophyllum pertusum TaxID=174260 RepID=A0A9W9YR79_9CNID|nr:Leucine-rich repeat-containing protein 56 [Desmophyllum pertusum]